MKLNTNLEKIIFTEEKYEQFLENVQQNKDRCFEELEVEFKKLSKFTKFFYPKFNIKKPTYNIGFPVLDFSFNDIVSKNTQIIRSLNRFEELGTYLFKFQRKPIKISIDAEDYTVLLHYISSVDE